MSTEHNLIIDYDVNRKMKKYLHPGTHFLVRIHLLHLNEVQKLIWRFKNY